MASESKWFWSQLADREDAERAEKSGMWAAIVVAVVTAAVATASVMTGQPVMSIDAWAYIDAVLFAVVAVGFLMHSRFLAVVGVLLFVLERVLMAQEQGLSGLPVAIILLLLFVNGARGTFAYHRFVAEEQSESESGEYENTSGMGQGHEIPDGVKGWSWGAFFFNWLWAIFNKTWFGLLSLVPVAGFLIALYLGFKGRELAWQNKRWDDLEHFNRVQRRWSAWCVALFVVPALLGIVAALVLPHVPAYQEYRQQKEITEAAKKKQDELEAFLANTVAATNKELPAMVDEETRFDSVSTDNQSFTYHYTLVNFTEGDMETAAFEAAMLPKVISGMCTLDTMKTFVENRIPLHFDYKDKNGKAFMHLTVDTGRCGDPDYVNPAPATVADGSGIYTLSRPEGWVDNPGLVPAANLVIYHPELGYTVYTANDLDNAQHIVDAVNTAAINLSIRLENPATTTCTPDVREDGTAFCEVSVTGCSEGTCYTYFLTALKRDNRTVFLGGFSEQAKTDAFVHIYRNIRDGFSWATPGPSTEFTAPAADATSGAREENSIEAGL